LNAHFCLSFVHCFPCLKNEGNTSPAWVVDKATNCCKSRGVGIFVFDCLVVRVSFILSKTAIFNLYRLHRFQNLYFRVSNTFACFRTINLCWSFHCKQSHNLKQMVLNDITYDAKIVKVTPTSISAKGFFEGEKDTLNTISIPHAFKPLIPKP